MGAWYNPSTAWEKMKNGIDRAWDTGRGLVVGIPEIAVGIGTGSAEIIEKIEAGLLGKEYQPDTYEAKDILASGAQKAFGPESGVGATVGGLPENVREGANVVFRAIDNTGKGIAIAGGTDIKFFTELYKTHDLAEASQVFSDDWQPFTTAREQTAEQAYAQLMAPHLAGAPAEQIQAELDRNPGLAMRANISHLVLGTLWDPTILGGKVVSVSRNLRFLTDVESGARTVHAANKATPEAVDAMLNSTRWHSKVNPAISKIIADNPETAAAALTRKFFGDTTAGHRLGSLLAEPDEVLRTHILKAANGNQASWEIVKANNTLKADELRRLVADTQRMSLVDLHVAQRDIKTLQGQAAVLESRLAKTDDPDVLRARIDQVSDELMQAERRAEDYAAGIAGNTERITDLNRSIGVTAGLRVGDESTLAVQSMPLFTNRQARIAGGNGVWTRLASHAPTFIQSSPFSTPMIFHGLGSRLPGRELNPHDLDSAATVRRWLDTLGTPKDETNRLVQTYLDAPHVAGRVAAFETIEKQAIRSHFDRWAVQTGKPRLTDEEMENVLAEVRPPKVTDTSAPTFGPQARTAEGELGPVIQRQAQMSDGTLHVVPNLETQIPSIIHLASPLHVRSTSALTYRHHTAVVQQRVAAGFDTWSAYWRAPVLMRTNYIVRNPAEEVLRTIPAARAEGASAKVLRQARRGGERKVTAAPVSALSRLVTRNGLTATEKIARNAGNLAISPVKLRLGDDSALRSQVEFEIEGLAGPKGDRAEMTELTAKGRIDPFAITAVERATRTKKGKLGAGYTPSGGYTSTLHPGANDPTKYLQDWAYVINRQTQQSALGQQILHGLRAVDAKIGPPSKPGALAALQHLSNHQNQLDEQIRKVAYWLQNSKEGKAVSARLLLGPGDHMDHARTVFAAIHTTMPPAVRQAAKGGKVDEKLLAGHLGVAPASINAEGMRILLAETRPQKVISDLAEKVVFGPSAHLQDALARIPLASAVYQERAQQLANTIGKAKAGERLSTERWVAEDYKVHAGVPFEVDTTLTPIGSYHGIYDHNVGTVPVIGPGDASMAQVGLIPGAKALKATADAPAVLIVRAKLIADAVNPEVAQFLPKITDAGQVTGMSVKDVDDFVRAVVHESPEQTAKWQTTLNNTLRDDGVDLLINPDRSTVVLNSDAVRIVRAPKDFQPDMPRGIVVGENYRVTPEEISMIQKQARHAAVAANRRAFYDSSKVSLMSAFLRHISPFIGATEDAARFWWRATKQSPHVTAGMVNAYHAPYRAGLVVDQHGQPVDPGDETAGPKRIVMPRVLAEIWAAGAETVPGTGGLGPFNVSMNPKNLNFVLQGDPGFSPLATLGLQAFAQRNPDLAEHLSGYFPYGMPASMSEALTPPVLNRLRTALIGGPDDPQLQRLANRYLAAEVVKKNLGLRPDLPTAEEALTAARHTVTLNLLNNLFLPTIGGTNVQSPFLPIMMDYNKAQESYRKDPTSLGREKDGTYRDPQAWLIDTYGDAYAPLTISAMKNLAGVDANSVATQRAEQFKDLISKHPDFAELFIGQTQGRNQNIYQAQVALGMREQLTPEEYLTKIRVSEGWKKWEKFSTMLDFKMRQLGVDNLRSKRAQPLVEIQKQFMDAMYTENYDWWKDKNVINVGRWEDFHRTAVDAVNDKELQKRPDMIALRDYLYQRSLLMNIMAKRGRGYSSLDSEGNASLRDIWDGVVNRLKDTYPEFGALHSRWLDDDPLKVGT